MPAPGARNFHVPPPLAGHSLGQVLRHWMPDESWNQIRQLLKSRRIMVQGNLCLDEGRRLKEGDVLKLLPHPHAAPPRAADVRIRHLDEHLVVIEKPAGITTLRHAEERAWPARRKQLQPTLEEVLPLAIAAYSGPKTSPKRRRNPHRQGQPPFSPSAKAPRVRAVHRLDRDTSGLMVFARSGPAEQALIQLFAKHNITRVYHAVIVGEIQAQTIETYLALDRGDGKRGSHPDPEQGQRAVTHLRPLESWNGYSLVECQLETGRTHQIRIHLAELGHVVCGEKVYHHQPKLQVLPDQSGSPRIALHAAELGFTHPQTGIDLHFDSPLPKDMVDLIARLKRGHRTTSPR